LSVESVLIFVMFVAAPVWSEKVQSLAQSSQNALFPAQPATDGSRGREALLAQLDLHSKQGEELRKQITATMTNQLARDIEEAKAASHEGGSWMKMSAVVEADPEAAKLAAWQQLPAKVFPTFRSRADFGDILSKLNLTTGVEIGVRHGDHAQLLLSKWWKCQRFVLVDAYRGQPLLQNTQNQSWFDNSFNKMLRKRIIRRNCQTNFREALLHPRCQIQLWLCRDLSHDCVNRYADQSFDFIYLDALHDRKSVLRDLRTWWPKLRSGGIMAGHDYMDFTAYTSRGYYIAAHKYSVNFDGTIDKSGGLTKGAVDDFFSCVVADETDSPPPIGRPCDHLRQVTVSYAISYATGSVDEEVPSWAVRK